MLNGSKIRAKELTTKLVLFLSLICAFGAQLHSQDLQKRAERNPLDCARFLASKNSSQYGFSINLARTYWRTGRRKDAIEVVDSNTDERDQQSTYAFFANELQKEGKSDESAKLWVKVVDSYRREETLGSPWKDNDLSNAVINLAKLNIDFHLPELLSVTDAGDDKALILIAFAEGKLSAGRRQEAADEIPQILALGSTSKWLDLQLLVKARVGILLLKLGKEDQANQLFKEVFENTQKLKVIENISKDDLWTEIAQGYQDVRQFDRAIQLLVEYRKTGLLNAKSYTDKKSIEIYLANNDRVRAMEMMEQLLTEDSLYDSIWIGDKFLSLGLGDKALEIAKSESNMYSQQKILLSVAAYFRERDEVSRALETLDLAVSRAKTIKTNLPEDGRLSDSPAFEQSRYLEKVADVYIDLNRTDLATNTIDLIAKPFIKARTLIHLSERQNRSQAITSLDLASSLVVNSARHHFDANRYSVWGDVGAAYASRGSKMRAVSIFKSLLSHKNEIIAEGANSYLLEVLTETGYWYEKAGLGDEPSITIALKKIIEAFDGQASN